jgi:dynein heavy chain
MPGMYFRYDNDLDRMQESLGALINAVAMIHSVSRFYNTQVHMSALFVKITNQMITSSKAFVYRLEPRLWEQEDATVLASLCKVKELHRAYQECFLQEKAKLEKNKEGPQFDFSVMSIFGKSIIFVERIEKIETMLTLIQQWTKLENCRIDGIDPFRVSFRMQFKSIKSKAYVFMLFVSLLFAGATLRAPLQLHVTHPLAGSSTHQVRSP